LFDGFICPALRNLGLGTWCTGPGTENKVVWNPFVSFPDRPALAWIISAGRMLGSALVVPPLEEIFYRSFLYRYLIRPDFKAVPLNEFRLGPFVITAAIFGFSHREWLAGILCGFIYH